MREPYQVFTNGKNVSIRCRCIAAVGVQGDRGDILDLMGDQGKSVPHCWEGVSPAH